MIVQLSRRQLVRRIRFHKQTIRRHGAEGLPLTELALVCEVAGKAKVSAQFRERRHEINGATVAVQQKSTRWTGMSLEQFVHPPESLKTMNAHREIAFSRERQLR